MATIPKISEKYLEFICFDWQVLTSSFHSSCWYSPWCTESICPQSSWYLLSNMPKNNVNCAAVFLHDAQITKQTVLLKVSLKLITKLQRLLLIVSMMHKTNCKQSWWYSPWCTKQTANSAAKTYLLSMLSESKLQTVLLIFSMHQKASWKQCF